MADATGQVRRRRVFYIPGYDPMPARRYREIYRREGALQAEISGYEIGLKPKPSDGLFGWEVIAFMDEAEVTANVEVLVWSDIVKGSMGQGILATYAGLVRTAWLYIGSGALFRLMRLRKGPVIAALYPIVMLLLQLGVAVGAGLALSWLFGLLVPSPLHWFGVVAIWPVLLAFRAQDGTFYAWYLMHDYAFTAKAQGANPPELEARMYEFARRIAKATHEDVDEVLVVGHSSGAHLAVSILADILKAEALGPTELSFLSLGHVIPMVSFLPGAERLRADLHYLAGSEDITWVDVTAPGDGCAFALCDPVSVSGVAPEGKRWPLVISAAFTQTLLPETWERLRWRFFRLHFQYLHAFDRPGDYDYFRITAGPLTLAERFRDRPPSASRIETPVSGYRTMAP
jgi:hypothetical protein